MLWSVLPHAAHVGAVEGALVTGLVTPHRLSVAARRLVRPRKPGARAFAATLSEVFEGHAPPESELERLAEDILGEAEIAGYVCQASRPGGERGRVDFLIELARLIVEADGRSWHARFENMRADRQRDLAHAAEGYLTVRIMWESAMHDRTRVVAGLRRTYQRRLAEQGLAA